MHPLRKQPLLEFLILLAGMISIMLLIQGTNTWIALSTTKQTPAIAKKEASELQKVAASTCAYSTVTLETTMTGDERLTNPTKDIKVYDPFDTSYLNEKVDSKTDWKRIANTKVDTNLPIIGSIFGYRPSKPAFYRVKEKDGIEVQRGWQAYLLGIPTTAGAELKTPRTGYDIGGGKMGLVTYATSDQIAIHIGRHEYLTGVGNSTAPGYEGKPRSGGYWIYLKGIQVNPDIVAQYNANSSTRDRLPALRTGDVFACATGSEVKIAVRDNGPFQDILGDEWWSGVQVKSDFSTPLGGSTTNPNNPVAPAAPAGSTTSGSNGTTSTTTTPGPPVPVATIQASIALPTGSIDMVKKLASQGNTEKRTRVLLLGDSNTANVNFGRVEMTWKSNNSNKIEYKKIAKGGWSTVNLMDQLRLDKDIDNNSVNYTDFKYALILIGLKDSDHFDSVTFTSNLSAIVDKLLSANVIPILQTINDFRNESSRKDTAETINNAIIAMAKEKKIPYVDTREYIKAGHMTKDGFHLNTKTYGLDYCNGTVTSGNCDPPEDKIKDDLNSPTTGHGIRNVILREAIRKIEKELDTLNQSIVVSANTGSAGLKPLTLNGVQAQTASESIISILQSYGSSGYLCYDFGGLSCVPATLSTIEGRAVRVDVTVDKSYPAKPVCVSRTNSCNGGIFLDPNL
jgi:lysophospholipase L1-like esterase